MEQAMHGPGENRQTAAATIAVALFYLQREAQATGLSDLAYIIDRAVREATDRATVADA